MFAVTTTIRKARSSELEEVLAILVASELTPDGLKDEASLILVAEGGDGIVACAALEIDGADALLRSVAVTAELRGAGLGRQIVDRAEAEARDLGVRTLYLLTTTAERFFDKLGYHTMDRAKVPEVVRGSAEFSACSSAGAIAMWRTI